MKLSVGAHFCLAAFSRWRNAITLFDALLAMRSSALPPSWKAMASLFCSTLSCAVRSSAESRSCSCAIFLKSGEKSRMSPTPKIP